LLFAWWVADSFVSQFAYFPSNVNFGTIFSVHDLFFFMQVMFLVVLLVVGKFDIGVPLPFGLSHQSTWQAW